MSRLMLFVCLGLLVAPMALAGGPPMLAVEMPAKPFDKRTEGAALVIRAQQCGQVLTAEVKGRAEGVVDGKRRTIPLKLEVTSQEGAWAVRKQWPDAGRWVLVFDVDNHGQATAIVELPERGGSTAPTVEMVNRVVPATEIDQRLNS